MATMSSSSHSSVDGMEEESPVMGELPTSPPHSANPGSGSHKEDGVSREVVLSKYMIQRCGGPKPATTATSTATSLWKAPDSSTFDSSWTLRDGVYREWAQKSSQVSPPGVNNSNALMWEKTLAHAMHLLRSERVSIVRRTFDVAATVVVNTVLQSSHARLEDEDESEVHCDDDQDAALLPPILQVLHQVSCCRDGSLSTVRHRRKRKGVSLDNDEWTKRKKMVATGLLAPSAGAGAAATGTKGLLSAVAAAAAGGVAGAGGALAGGHAASRPGSRAGSATHAASYAMSAAGGIDSRCTVSRAILCAAVSIAFRDLTPSFEGEGEVNPLQIPQNATEHESSSASNNSLNMGAVMMQAEIFGKRAVEHALGAARRCHHRKEYRMELILQKKQQLRETNHLGVVTDVEDSVQSQQSSFLSLLKNPFMSGGAAYQDDEDEDDDDEDDSDDDAGPCFFNRHASMVDTHGAITQQWTHSCIPRLLTILRTGLGHFVLHELQWSSRATRIASFLYRLTQGIEVDGPDSDDDDNDDDDDDDDEEPDSPTHKKTRMKGNYGPHLIVTTSAELLSFRAAIQQQHHDGSRCRLSCIVYDGPRKRRATKLRKWLSPDSLTGMASSPYHVVLTSYSTLVADYVHLCQVPFDCVIMDEGLSWLGVSHFDPNGQLGKVWEAGIWTKSDNHAGLAGVGPHYDGWDFEAEDDEDEEQDQNGDGDDEGGNGGGSKNKNRKSLDGGGGSSAIPVASVVTSDDEEDDDDDDDDDKEQGANKQQRTKGGKGSTSKQQQQQPPVQHQTKYQLKKRRKNFTPSLIGLSARHKILLASSMSATYRDTTLPAPVPALLTFLVPHFADVVREEWDRSRIHNCTSSMKHVRKLLGRCVVVHTGDAGGNNYNNSMEEEEQPQDSLAHQDLASLAFLSLEGKLDKHPHYSETRKPAGAHHPPDSDDDDGEDNVRNRGADGMALDGTNNHSNSAAASVVSTDDLVANGKITQSRRSAASWLHPQFPLRAELFSTSLDPILEALQVRASTGHVCEEVVTASSVTSSGAGGAVAGVAAYRAAIRCGRTFTSEQGLRQHMAALHAPPGTWLCRSCGGDCGTSQARTHHERYCGTATAGGGGNGASVGGTPTVGQGIGSSKGGATGGKGKKGSSGAAAGSVTSAGGDGTSRQEDKDPDGSFRVPSYRGVWLNPLGKHFVKVNGGPVLDPKKEEEGATAAGALLLFNTAEEAAHCHDDEVVKLGLADKTEMNYRKDGTRIVYEDSAAVANAGRGLEVLGGGASSVVPALSVINIKDLPKDVKPLLRDPRQTSRVGGNSKRYVYAYRGVCRQARKGHDRWQSQISFGGTNHYLGTFDSEWDAAAIYAWAHLILYGEEATKKAQKEGEEAAAAYEQEKKDIAAGKIPAPVASTEKKKKPPKKPKEPGAAGAAAKGPGKGGAAGKKKGEDAGKKGSSGAQSALGTNANSEQIIEATGPEMVAMAANAALMNGTLQAPWMAHWPSQMAAAEEKLISQTSTRFRAIRASSQHVGGSVRGGPSLSWPVALPSANSNNAVAGCLRLVGLSSVDFGWSVSAFLDSRDYSLGSYLTRALEEEYSMGGHNTSFSPTIRSVPCTIGREDRGMEALAQEFLSKDSGMGFSSITTDCDIGGVEGSCAGSAARFSYSSVHKTFEFEAASDDDSVTLNGRTIDAGTGLRQLQNGDVCSVGARVFVVLMVNEGGQP